MHDSSICELCRGLPIRSSLSDDEFFAFLASCRNELAVKQVTFERRIQGASRWSYDMVEGTLVIDDLLFGMTPIGTHSQPPNSWLWAWGNEDFPATARTASRRIQSLHTFTGFRVFIDPATQASSDAQDFTALAVHILHAMGCFRCPSDEPVLYLAVHEVDQLCRQTRRF
jgi:hypothetical protein